MAEEYQEVAAAEVRPGARVRVRGVEITVARVEERFLNRPGMIAFIEDTAERWFKVPVQADATVEVAPAG